MTCCRRCLDNPQASAYDAVVETAKTYITGDFAAGWRKALHDGWVMGTAFTPKTAAPAGAAIPAGAPSSGIEIAFRHDPSLYDGRYANIGWLQEIPRQVTNLSWDNAAIMSLNTMDKLKLAESEAIELNLNGRKVDCAGADGSGPSGRCHHGPSRVRPQPGRRRRICRRVQRLHSSHVGGRALRAGCYGHRRQGNVRSSA